MRMFIYLFLKVFILKAYKYRLIKSSEITRLLNLAKHGKPICEICGNRIRYRHRGSIDHVIPKSDKLINHYTNYRIAHPKCNELRGNNLKMSDIKYYQYLQRELNYAERI